MTRSLVLSIPMSVEDSESRRFELNIWLSFSQADLGPTSGQEWFFSFFFGKVCNFFFFEDFVLIASGTTVTVAVTRQMCDYSRVKASFAVNICTCSCILLILRDSCSVCLIFRIPLFFFVFFLCSACLVGRLFVPGTLAPQLLTLIGFQFWDCSCFLWT